MSRADAIRAARGQAPLGFRWICPTCAKARRTAYCQDCGTAMPDQSDVVERHLDVLRKLAFQRGTDFAREYNSAQTYFEKSANEEAGPHGWNYEASAQTLLERSRIAKTEHEAIAWAVSMLEQGGGA